MKYSGFLRRLFAFAIDVLTLVGIYLFLGLFFSISTLSGALIALPMVGFWFYGGLFLTSWLYFACLESSECRATIGKQLLGLEVVTQEGKRLSFVRASARYFLQAFVRIGVVLIFFTKRKQALHDKIVKSVVISR
jgi:uncharacterized RDD family membrane protein YckC